MSFLVLRIRSRRHRARVDGGASRSVGYHLAIAKELRNQLHIRSLAAAGACARKFKQRGSKLRVLHIGPDVHQVLLAFHVVCAVFPIGGLVQLAFQVNHRQCLAAFLRVARAYVHAVSAAQAVEHVHLHAERHAVECLAHSLQHREVGSLLLLGIKHERTDGSMRANIRTLVALDAVLGIPYRHKSSHAAFFILGSARFPRSVLDAFEGRNGQQVAVLRVDRPNHFVDESRIVVLGLFIVGQVNPCRVNGQLLVFAATVYSCIVLVDHVFSLLAI